MAVLRTTSPWELAALAWLVVLGVPLTVIDLRSSRLPNRLTAAAFAGVIALLAAGAAASHAPGHLGQALLGSVALAGFYLLLAAVRPGGMGLGDVKLAASVGAALAWLSWPAVFAGTLAAFLLAAVAGLALLAARRGARPSHIPFGPFMLAGMVIAAALHLL